MVGTEDSIFETAYMKWDEEPERAKTLPSLQCGCSLLIISSIHGREPGSGRPPDRGG